MTVHIDGDVVAYKAAFSTEYQTYHCDGLVFRYKDWVERYIEWNFDEDERPSFEKVLFTEPLEKAEFAVDSIMNTILRAADDNDFKVFISGDGTNFRKQVEYPVEYKGGRPPKPSTYKTAYDYLVKKYKAIRVNGIEVDDALGIFQTDNTIIASVDKDLRMIEGAHLNINDEKPSVFYVSKAEATKNFYLQMLTGDRVDNIIGIRGIGPARANKLLAEADPKVGYKPIVIREYMKEFGDNWEKMYQANCKLLWILRDANGIDHSFT